MEPWEVAQVVEQIWVDVDSLTNPHVREIVVRLLNLVEKVAAENRRLGEENERLKEEIRCLRGDAKMPRPRPPAANVSSEKERKERPPNEPAQPKPDHRTFKDVPVHEEEICPVDPQQLPADAVFVGYEDVVVQDLKIEPHNIKFRQEIWYSPSLERHFHGCLPPGYVGEFGPQLKSLMIALKYAAGTSERGVRELVENFGVQISPASVSNVFLQTAELFHGEKSDIYRAGLESTCYQQIDDTSANVGGQYWHTHIVCNPMYTAYFTTKRKDRLTVLDVLRDFAPRTYRLNEETRQLLEEFHVPQKWLARLAELPPDRDLTQAEMDELLAEWFPHPEKGQTCRARILEAAAIASYHHQQEIVVPILVCDDAGQFKLVTEKLALCWIHEGRHYKQFSPVVPLHQQKLAEFVERYWDFYGQLQAYRQQPEAAEGERLSAEFDRLFSTHTGYDDLDERIAKTGSKKGSLLTVLEHPQVPLHNNESELGARVSARRRDVSLHTQNARGTRAMDTYTTIVQTAKKLGVSAYAYLHDRISCRFALPSLASLILARAPPLGFCHRTD